MIIYMSYDNDIEHGHIYHNKHGYSGDAHKITLRVREFVINILEEYPEYNALELTGLIHNAIIDAFCRVSIERRLGPHE